MGGVLLLDGGNVDIYHLFFLVIFRIFSFAVYFLWCSTTAPSNTGWKTGGARHTENSIKPTFIHDSNGVQSKCWPYMILALTDKL